MIDRPRCVNNAIHAIWLTLALEALAITVGYDATHVSTDSLVFNILMLAYYALVTIKIGAGRNWARRTYAFLVALECALLAAFGLDQASELDTFLTYLTVPLELWILVQLFGTQADAWFAAQGGDAPR